MKIFRIAVLLVLFVAACEDKLQNSDSLVGAWYYIDLRDTTYNEIYFTKERLIQNLSSMGLSNVYEYEISNDSILIGQEREFFLKLTDKPSNKFSALDTHGHPWIFERLDLAGDDSYKKFILPEARIIRLQKGRVLRGNKTLLERGLVEPDDSISDSLLFVPQPEKGK